MLQRQWEGAKARLEGAWRLVQSLNPDRVLERGYARVTTRTGETLASAAAARAAAALTLRFRDATLDVHVVDGKPAKVERAKVEREGAKPYVAARKPDQPTLL